MACFIEHGVSVLFCAASFCRSRHGSTAQLQQQQQQQQPASMRQQFPPSSFVILQDSSAQQHPSTGKSGECPAGQASCPLWHSLAAQILN
jgi:hypothetical protein